MFLTINKPIIAYHKTYIKIPKEKTQDEFAEDLAQWAWNIITHHLPIKPTPQKFDVNFTESSIGAGPGNTAENWTETHHFKYGTPQLGVKIAISTSGQNMIYDKRIPQDNGVQFSTYGFDAEQYLRIQCDMDFGYKMLLEWNLSPNLHHLANGTLHSFAIHEGDFHTK